MKIKKHRLKELVQHLVQEAAKEGRMQKVYRQSFADMIHKTEEGGNGNTPPFTEKAAAPGKSSPILETQKEIDALLYEGAFSAAGQAVKKGLRAINQEIQSASHTGNLLRRLLVDKKKLTAEERKDLESGLDTLAVPTMIIAFLVGGVGGAGAILLLSQVARAFNLGWEPPPPDKSHEPHS